jgi:hypothetical protein
MVCLRTTRSLLSIFQNEESRLRTRTQLIFYTITPIVRGRLFQWNGAGEATNMMITLLVILLLLSLGSLPTWPHSRNWGYYPSGGLGLVVIVLLVLLLLGRV